MTDASDAERAEVEALNARVAQLREALSRASKMIGPHSLHPDAEGLGIIDTADAPGGESTKEA